MTANRLNRCSMRKVTEVVAGEHMWLISLPATKRSCSMDKRQGMNGTRESLTTATTIRSSSVTRRGTGMRLKRTTATTIDGTRPQAQRKRQFSELQGAFCSSCSWVFRSCAVHFVQLLFTWGSGSGRKSCRAMIEVVLIAESRDILKKSK